MPAPVIRIINGIQYPREVAVLDGMPTGWKGVEQAYGENSKYYLSTYTRYKSDDGRHKQVMGPKQVVQLHCDDNGLEFATEYKKYEDACTAKKEEEARLRKIDQDARGQAQGEKREEQVARSREKFGELTGQIVFAFPGWRCRWEYMTQTGQTPKHFFDAEGREWRLLKDYECFIGSRLEKGDAKEIAALEKMVEAGKNNFAAHEKFSTGTRIAKESQGACELCNAKLDDVVVHSSEVLAQQKADKLTKKGRKREAKKLTQFKDSLFATTPSYKVAQTGWAAIASENDVVQAFLEFKALLAKRGFSPDTVLIAVHGVGEPCRYADRVNGVYVRMGAALNERALYQKLLHDPKLLSGIACDGIYLMWSAEQKRWQVSTLPSESGSAIAILEDDVPCPSKSSGTWKAQSEGRGDFETHSSLRITVSSSE